MVITGTNNGATLSTGRKGEANGSYSFDGVDDYIDCGNDESLDITDEITISAWIYDNIFPYDVVNIATSLSYYLIFLQEKYDYICMVFQRYS